MAKTKIKLKVKKYNWGKIIFVVFFVYLSFSLINIRLHISDKKDEVNKMKTEIGALQEQNENISRMLDANQQKEYIERIAREKLGFLYPNERVYINVFGN